MKNLLKKLHIMPNQSEDNEGSTSSRHSNKSIDSSNLSPDKSFPSGSHHNPELKPLSGLSNWFNSVANRHSINSSPPNSSLVTTRHERMEPSDSVNSSNGFDVVSVSDSVAHDSGSSSKNLRGHEKEEEYQIQLALEMSAREDPEAVQIEAVKQISLGSCDPHNTPAEIIAYRYWNYNSLGFDDKILDGFYDLYEVLTQSTSERMPSLVDLQGTPVSESITWEAILVNRSADANLLKLEQKALEIVIMSRSDSLLWVDRNLVKKLAILVADHMGGPVGDPVKMFRRWKTLSHDLKASLGSMVLPIGSLTVGLARHRALLFKLLADGVGIPCRLVKGQQYTGSDDVAMNFVKIDDGREYIVDLMADPGTLIPSDIAGSHIEYGESFFSATSLSKDLDPSHAASSSSGAESSIEENLASGKLDKRSRFHIPDSTIKESDDQGKLSTQQNPIGLTKYTEGLKKSSDNNKNQSNPEKMQVHDIPERPNHLYLHTRSPSWTEGVSSPAVRKMKVKDVSQYMIDAAKENPKLAQKLHDVLLESGVVAPPNLFTEIYHEKEVRDEDNDKEDKRAVAPVNFLPPLPPPHRFHSKSNPIDKGEVLNVNLVKFKREVPVTAAAAAAAAAVVASTVVVAAAKSNTDKSLELPVAAAATATAAAVVATTAVVSSPGFEARGGRDNGTGGESLVGERVSDSMKSSDTALDDVAECEIQWEEITLGERIGLGSYGEVYRGDWRGTEVAVKKFLDQGISGESLEEFKSEVRIMKKLRHPNVVLFMGAVTRAPNLSIITEFLPRGSLYRLIHRPNNQLDERRRLRMALDAARGMNYLHNCSPVIVHRDLKSPNLLVDKNWTVKVCDFGLSRMKHSTFLSTRSTAGTAEWMAPEVLRNEQADEKCDVFSYGVILWELSTMQQPWGGMNPMQVVGAVGFQHRRLDIPDDMDPTIADIIRKCWQTDPKLRPTFGEIMAALKPLQRPITSSQAPRPSIKERD